MAKTPEGDLEDLCSIPRRVVVYLCPNAYIVYDSELCLSFLSTK